MAKVLITETVHSAGPELLRAAGHEVVFADRDEAVIRREIVDADAVLTRIYKLPGELLATGKQLKIVSKHGVGYDNIDLEYCKQAGVAVTIAPGANSQSVAEHAFAMMLALAKRLPSVSAAYKRIGFAAKNSPEGMELDGKTVGVLGIGRIGARFARMCLGAFGMRVLACDPYVDGAPEGVELVDDPDVLFREADVVSLHATLTDETRKIVNARRLALMKPRSILINCARGPMVDEQALIAALESGVPAAAGLDVTDPEPVDPASPLFRMDNVIVTPHYAPTTLESAIRTSQVASENVVAYLSGQEPVGRIV